MPVFVYKKTVEFADTDMGGIVHFSCFFRYMEEAEHHFLRSIGLSVMMQLSGKKVGFPRVSAHCDYFKPARFADELLVSVQIEKIGASSITYALEIMCGVERIAAGKVVAVLCEMQENSPPKSIPIPQDIRTLLGNGVLR